MREAGRRQMIRLLFNELCVVCAACGIPYSVSVCRTTIDPKIGFPRTLSIYLLGPDPTMGLKNIKTGPCVFVGRERLGEGEGGRLCSIWVVTGEE